MRKIFRAFWQVITFPFRFIYWLLSIEDFIFAVRSPEDDDTPIGGVISKVFDNPSGAFEHLVALRNNVFRSVIVLAMATGLAFYFNTTILEFLARPMEGGMEALVAIDVTEPVGTVMRVSLLTGFLITFPYIAYQVWLFWAPGMLKRRNRITSLFAIPASVFLFYSGVLFAYFLLLPQALPFLLNFMGINTIPRPTSYIKFTTSLMFWIGIAFQLPLVLPLLTRMGVIRAEVLAQQWRLAIIIIAVVAAMITPTVDPVNMALVMGPLSALYFLSVGFAMLAQRGRSIEEA